MPDQPYHPKRSTYDEEESDSANDKIKDLNREWEYLSSGVQTAKDKAQGIELNMELNELSHSIKAAKEKAQKLVIESNETMAKKGKR